MKRILLDTSAYSAFRRTHPGLLAVLQEASDIVFNPIVLAELLAGYRRGNRFEHNRLDLRDFLSVPTVRTVQIDEETAEFWALIEADLRGRGRPLPTNDIWIAASAMQHGLAVVTTDRHFAEIPQIRALILEV